MSSEVEVGKMSFAELVALRTKLDSEIEAKRSEELKVLADGFAKKLQAAGFTVAEGVDALKPYLAGGRGASRAAQGAVAPVLYRDTANPQNTWSGRGRPARWLADYEAAGRNREEFRATAS